MTKNLAGFLLRLEFHRGPFLDLCYFYLIYINDLSDGLVQDLNESAKYLNLDLSVISRWACQWKMLFNPDPKKPAHEVIFSRKKNEEAHASVFFHNIEVSHTDSQKH